MAVMVLLLMVTALLWTKTGWVQLHEGAELEKRASLHYFVSELAQGVRGRILDRNGKLLATSAQAQSVCAFPYEVKENLDVTADQLSRILGIARSTVRKTLAARKNYVWIQRQITDKQAMAVRKAGLKGVQLTPEYRRLYPNRYLAGQILGFTDVDGVGREGVEGIYQKRMIPGETRYVVQRDRKGSRLYLDTDGRGDNIDGQDVVLTIDTQIQHAAEESLAKSVAQFEAKAGIAMVVDIKSGDILALANYPFFNPNIYRNTPPGQRRLRAATDIYEPGSTMKPFLFASALEEKVITPDQLIFCENGRWTVGRRIIRDHSKEGWLPVHKVLRYSSNIGSAKIGLDLGAGVYHAYLSRLGFGSKTGLSLPGESGGILMEPGRWTDVDLANISFGQGIGVTALQLARAYLCLANRGMTKELHLVLNPETAQEEHPVRVFSEETAATVMSMMKDVVQEDGTGRSARVPGITMAGKTGTAQKASPQGGYGEKRLASFVGMIPAEDPEILFLAMVDEPEKASYGSVVAAPVVRETAMAVLAYRGRLPEDPDALVEEARTDDPLPDPLLETASVEETAGNMVPDIRGLPVRRAMELLIKQGVVPVLKGEGTVVKKQEPAAGQPWPAQDKEGKNHVFILWLS